MKKLHISGILLKALVLGALLTGCQNDEALSPQETAGIAVNDQNAKVTTELKLVKDGTTTLQYIKQGRFMGKLSKVSKTAEYTLYSYDDSSGDLWITSKTYTKSNDALINETKYKILRGICVTRINVTSGWTSQYIYNEAERLDEINMSSGALTQKWLFTYDYNPATGSDRLNHIVKSTPVGDYEQINFFYTVGLVSEKKDVYKLNSQFLGIDPYLPYFSKSSDVLIQQVFVKPLPFSNQAIPHYKLFYSFDANGYAIGRNIEFYPLGWAKEAGKQTFYNVYQYSTGWQGL